MESCRILLKKYGSNPNSIHFLDVLNTDFSAKFSIFRKINPRNDGVWVNENSLYNNSILNHGVKKYNGGIMLWGAVTGYGLVPKNEPFNFTKWLEKQCKKD